MSEKFEEMTKDELMEEAQRLDIDGRSGMDKAELLAAVQAADGGETASEVESTQDTSAGHTEKVVEAEQQTENGGFKVEGAGETGSEDGLSAIPEATGTPANGSDTDPVLDSEADRTDPEITYVGDTNTVKSRREEEDEQHERRKAADARIEEQQAQAKTNPW